MGRFSEVVVKREPSYINSLIREAPISVNPYATPLRNSNSSAYAEDGPQPYPQSSFMPSPSRSSIYEPSTAPTSSRSPRVGGKGLNAKYDDMQNKMEQLAEEIVFNRKSPARQKNIAQNAHSVPKALYEDFADLQRRNNSTNLGEKFNTMLQHRREQRLGQSRTFEEPSFEMAEREPLLLKTHNLPFSENPMLANHRSSPRVQSRRTRDQEDPAWDTLPDKRTSFWQRKGDSVRESLSPAPPGRYDLESSIGHRGQVGSLPFSTTPARPISGFGPYSPKAPRRPSFAKRSTHAKTPELLDPQVGGIHNPPEKFLPSIYGPQIQKRSRNSSAGELWFEEQQAEIAEESRQPFPLELNPSCPQSRDLYSGQLAKEARGSPMSNYCQDALQPTVADPGTPKWTSAFDNGPNLFHVDSLSVDAPPSPGRSTSLWGGGHQIGNASDTDQFRLRQPTFSSIDDADERSNKRGSHGKGSRSHRGSHSFVEPAYPTSRIDELATSQGQLVDSFEAHLPNDIGQQVRTSSFLEDDFDLGDDDLQFITELEQMAVQAQNAGDRDSVAATGNPNTANSLPKPFSKSAFSQNGIMFTDVPKTSAPPPKTNVVRPPQMQTPQPYRRNNERSPGPYQSAHLVQTTMQRLPTYSSTPFFRKAGQQHASLTNSQNSQDSYPSPPAK
ncbi:hypothetical protein DFS34DRAFT_625569 [Phlyctochytrium arcticum]|nr:hypothetical protein DFS34DRAFT_625569 [Phlyctochytrium arcticum]